MMGISSLQGIFDRAKYEEHQLSGFGTYSSLTDILNITGKGFLESAILYQYSSANNLRLKVIKDGATILDENANSQTYHFFGIVQDESIKHMIDNSGNYITIIDGFNNSSVLVNNTVYNSSNSEKNYIAYPSFPSATEQSIYGCAFAKVTEPIYFKASLQIQMLATIGGYYYVRYRI
jgi:hypothetical protein